MRKIQQEYLTEKEKTKLIFIFFLTLVIVLGIALTVIYSQPVEITLKLDAKGKALIENAFYQRGMDITLDEINGEIHLKIPYHALVTVLSNFNR